MSVLYWTTSQERFKIAFEIEKKRKQTLQTGIKYHTFILPRLHKVMFSELVLKSILNYLFLNVRFFIIQWTFVCLLLLWSGCYLKSNMQTCRLIAWNENQQLGLVHHYICHAITDTNLVPHCLKSGRKRWIVKSKTYKFGFKTYCCCCIFLQLSPFF